VAAAGLAHDSRKLTAGMRIESVNGAAVRGKPKAEIAAIINAATVVELAVSAPAPPGATPPPPGAGAPGAPSQAGSTYFDEFLNSLPAGTQQELGFGETVDYVSDDDDFGFQ